ncbi:MAG: formylglycine-generating enzyme family protein, partial [Actinomycetota bacterium]|nr:formylglycine-generating enzyme family protein [Actinomycetota bacterium]
GGPEALIGVLDDRDADFATRYAAGSLLGLCGDPRIRPDDPPMVDLPGGDVWLGTLTETVDEVTDRWAAVGVLRDWIAKEAPRHQRTVSPFRMAVHPVTNLEYARFIADTGSARTPTSWRFGVYPHHVANHPVWTVTAEDADAYAEWLARRTGRSFRLPTEAEWEYAASGGDGREYPWGGVFDTDRANTVEHGLANTTPVGCYPAGDSPFGLKDMAGNVEEYTADDYVPYPGGDDVRDDLVVECGAYRVTRGGAFSRYGDLARCARRHGWYPREFYAVGLRLAESR